MFFLRRRLKLIFVSQSNVLNVGKSSDRQLLLLSTPRNQVIKNSKSLPRR